VRVDGGEGRKNLFPEGYVVQQVWEHYSAGEGREGVNEGGGPMRTCYPGPLRCLPLKDKNQDDEGTTRSEGQLEKSQDREE